MPVNPYLGFSALTGQVSEYHDIISVSSSSAILSTNNPATQGVKTKKKKGSSYKPRGGGGVGWFLFFLKGIGTLPSPFFALLAANLGFRRADDIFIFLLMQHSSSSPALDTLPMQSTRPRRRSRIAASGHGKAQKNKTNLARIWEEGGKEHGGGFVCKEVFREGVFLVRVEEAGFLSTRFHRWPACLSHPALIPIVPFYSKSFRPLCATCRENLVGRALRLWG